MQERMKSWKWSWCTAGVLKSVFVSPCVACQARPLPLEAAGITLPHYHNTLKEGVTNHTTTTHWNLPKANSQPVVATTWMDHGHCSRTQHSKIKGAYYKHHLWTYTGTCSTTQGPSSPTHSHLLDFFTKFNLMSSPKNVHLHFTAIFSIHSPL